MNIVIRGVASPYSLGRDSNSLLETRVVYCSALSKAVPWALDVSPAFDSMSQYIITVMSALRAHDCE